MATIIQPYNPWREQFAANLIGPLLGNVIGDAIKRHQEANANRKLNTAIGTTLQNLGTMGQQSMMNGQPVPEGYDDDQWAKAAHKSYTPMTQYNMGTADITPQNQLTPTAMDVQKSLAETLANPRFAMVNSMQAQQALTPYLQSLEQANLMQRRTDAANAVSKAENDRARLAALYRAGVMGDLSPDLIKLAQGQYQFNNPHMQSVSYNMGNRTSYGAFNPKNGIYTEQGMFSNNMTPYQLAQLGQQQDLFNLQWNSQQYTVLNNTLTQKNAEIAQLTEEIDATKDETAKNALRARINLLRNEVQQIENQMHSLFNPSYGNNNSSVANLNEYADIVNKYASEYGVDPDLIMAILQQESGGNVKALSNKGAHGLMQLMPGTARDLGVTDPYDPEQNIAGGIRYLAQQLKAFNGDTEKALWAYNAGPGRVQSGYMPDETKKYIRNVMGIYNKRKGQRNTQRNPQPAASTQTQPTQSTQPKDTSTILFPNSPVGPVTENQYKQLLSLVETGKIDGIKNKEQLDKHLGRRSDTPLDLTPSYMRVNMSSAIPAIDIKTVPVQQTPPALPQAPITPKQPRQQTQDLDPLLLPPELQPTPNNHPLDLSIPNASMVIPDNSGMFGTKSNGQSFPEESKPKEQFDKYLLPDYSASSMPNDVDPLNVLNGIDTNDIRQSVKTLQSSGVNVDLSDPAILEAIVSMSKKDGTYTTPTQWSWPVKGTTTQGQIGEYLPYDYQYNSWPSNFDSSNILSGIDPQELQQRIKALQASGVNVDLSDPFDPAILTIIAGMRNN